MKKVLICGMLLGLLPSLAWAQRGRVAGGIGSSARMPSVGSVPSNVGIHPGAVNVGHDGVAPNATPSASPVGTQSKTVSPANGGTANNSGTNPKTIPDRVIPADTGTMSPVTGVGPER